MNAFGFELGGGEKIDERQAKIIRYGLGKRDGLDTEKITLWIDAQTLLPLKRSFTVEKAPVTELYQQFKLDPPIAADAFKLPKAVPAPTAPEDNAEPKKVPVPIKEASGGFATFGITAPRAVPLGGDVQSGRPWMLRDVRDIFVWLPERMVSL